MAQAVSDLLGDPAGNVHRSRQLPSVEWAGEFFRQQASYVGPRCEQNRLADGHEALVFHHVVVFSPTPPPAVTRVAPFLDLDQQDLQCEPLVRKNVDEVHQLLE